MNVLLLIRLVTLVGWVVLVACLARVVVIRDEGMSKEGRGAWLVLLIMHVIIALNTTLMELAWALKVIQPDSPLIALAQELYNPTYLVNAAVAACVPFLVVALLLGNRPGRRLILLVGFAVFGLPVAVASSGLIEDWSTLMVSTQILSFVAIVGFLSFWGFVLLGSVPRTDGYLLAFMAVLTVFHVLLPVQAEFFELVGRGKVVQVWHLHQVLQLALVLAEIGIVTALARRISTRRSTVEPSVPLGVD